MFPWLVFSYLQKFNIAWVLLSISEHFLMFTWTIENPLKWILLQRHHIDWSGRGHLQVLCKNTAWELWKLKLNQSSVKKPLYDYNKNCWKSSLNTPATSHSNALLLAFWRTACFYLFSPLVGVLYIKCLNSTWVVSKTLRHGNRRMKYVKNIRLLHSLKMLIPQKC